MSVVARSSAPEAWSTDGLWSRSRCGWKLFIFHDVPLDSWIACDPCGNHARMSTHGHTRTSTTAISSLGRTLVIVMAFPTPSRPPASEGGRLHPPFLPSCITPSLPPQPAPPLRWGGSLAGLAGPLASDEAARSLAAIYQVRLPSCSESSSVCGSSMLWMM